MLLRDKHYRVIAELSRTRLQIGTFVIERTTGNINGLIVGHDPTAITAQKICERCTKCERHVPVACEVDYDPERCMQGNGPWDYACDMFYYPWKYE